MDHLVRMLTAKKPKVFRDSVRLRDKAVYTSQIYEVFDIIYDKDGKFVRHFYICKFCNDVFHIEYDKSGNSQLKAHVCYQKYTKGKPKCSGKKGERKHVPLLVVKKQMDVLIPFLVKVSIHCATTGQKINHENISEDMYPLAWSKEEFKDFYKRIKEDMIDSEIEPDNHSLKKATKGIDLHNLIIFDCFF